MRIGVGRQYFGRNSKVDKLVEPHLQVLKDGGATLIDVEFPNRAIDQAACRLAAIAGPRVFADLAVGMMRTIVIPVDRRAARLEHPRDPLVDERHGFFGEKSARHTGLIRDHHDPHVGAIQSADGVNGPGKKRDALGTIEVSHFLDDGAVAIQEHAAFEGARHSVFRASSAEIPSMQA